MHLNGWMIGICNFMFDFTTIQKGINNENGLGNLAPSPF